MKWEDNWLWIAENNQLYTKEEMARWNYHNGNLMKEVMEITKIKVNITMDSN